MPGEGVKFFHSWSIDGNKPIHKIEVHSSNPVNPFGQIGVTRINYAVTGKTCGITWQFDPVPGFSFQSGVDVRGCNLRHPLIFHTHENV